MFKISGELREVLNKIAKESPIAYKLLYPRVEDLREDYVSYVGVSDSDPNKISYLTGERYKNINKNEVWRTSRRYHSKPGAFVNKVLSGFTDKQIEDFVNLYKGTTSKLEYTFSIVSGQEILKYYYRGSYKSESGSLGASCMKHEQSQKFLNMYVDNADKVQLLILLDNNNKLLGRALLWKTEEGTNVMDRIYTIEDDVYQHYFRRWAMSNNHIYRKVQKWNNSLHFIEKNKEVIKHMSVKLDYHLYKYFPYMDTFKFYDYKSGLFYNYKPEDENMHILMCASGGKFDITTLMLDKETNIYYNNSDMVYLDYISEYVYRENINRTIWGSYGRINDIVESKLLRGYVFKKEYSRYNPIQSIKQRLAKIASMEGLTLRKDIENFDIYNGVLSDFVEQNKSSSKDIDSIKIKKRISDVYPAYFESVVNTTMIDQLTDPEDFQPRQVARRSSTRNTVNENSVSSNRLDAFRLYSDMVDMARRSSSESTNDNTDVEE